MAGPEDELAKSSPWWGVISEGARLHETTQQLWDRIRAESERTGLPIPPEGATFINAARSAYGALAEARERLARAPGSNAITGDYLAPLPYGAGVRSPAGPRLFHVRVAYTYQAGGDQREDYVTLRYTGGLPATVEQLRADAEVVTAGLLPGYGREFVGLGDIEIGEL